MDVDRPQKRVFSFLEQVAKETTVSKSKARLELARKMNELSRHKQRRRKQRERLRKMAKDLDTTEAQIQLVTEDIKRLESVVEEGTDDITAPAVSSEPSSAETTSSSETKLSQPKQGIKREHDELDHSNTDDQQPTKTKQAKIVVKLQDLDGEFTTEKLAELPSDRLFQAHQHVNSMMESIMAALKVKVKPPSMST